MTENMGNSNHFLYQVIFKGITIDVVFCRVVDVGAFPFVTLKKIISEPTLLNHFQVLPTFIVNNGGFARYRYSEEIQLPYFNIIQIERMRKNANAAVIRFPDGVRQQ